MIDEASTAGPGRLRWGISIPQFTADGAFDPSEFRAYLERAEALGFDSAWALEQVLGTKDILGTAETMAYAAACTTRLRLGCSVIVSPRHNPVHLAKSLSTLDQLCHGRLEIGIGRGAPGQPLSPFEIDTAGVTPRFTEGLALMKALWTEPEVTFDGRFWRLEGAGMQPKPFQKPHPPVWIGASHPNAVRRAVMYGDGFFGAGSSTTAAFAEQVKVARQALAEAGRDPVGFPIAKRIYIAVDEDAERARRRMAQALVDVYGPEFGGTLEPVTVIGPPQACVQGVREVVEAGAEMVLLTAPFDQAEQMERLAAEVIPGVT